MKWQIEFTFDDAGRNTSIGYSSTAGLVNGLIGGVAMAAPGAIRLRYVGPTPCDLAHAVLDDPGEVERLRDEVHRLRAQLATARTGGLGSEPT